MDEVGAREIEAATERRPEAAVLDEHARHGEPEQREPGEREEIDPFEDGDARHRQREERHRAREQCASRGIPSSGRDDTGPQKAQSEKQRPDEKPVRDRDPAVDERGADGERGGRKRDQQAAPEVVAVELDRVGDQLADRSLGR